MVAPAFWFYPVTPYTSMVLTPIACRRLCFQTALLAAIAYSQPQQARSAVRQRHHTGKSSSRLASYRSTFLYGLTPSYSPDNPTIRSENEIVAFRLRRNDSFVAVPLKGNVSGDSGIVNFLTASPDGHFLVAECENTNDGNYDPLFVQYRIQADGQLKPFDRYGMTNFPGATHLVFHPSGRYAYLSWPDQSNSQTRPGAVVQFRVTSKGYLTYPPVASVPCGPMPTALALDAQGRVGGVLDDETGFLWQYTLTPQGRLQPTRPPSVPVAKDIFPPLITRDGRFMYVESQQSRQRYRIYQLRRNASGGFSLLMPWAVRVPQSIYSMAISNRHRALYVSSGTRLLMFRISPQGTLQPSHFSINTVVGLNMTIDEVTGYLYVMGLQLRAYRIRENGALTALGKVPKHTNIRINDLTVVHR